MAKRGGERRALIALIVLIGIAFGLWGLVQRSGPEQSVEHKYQLQKTGAGIIVDFTKAAREVDAAVLKTVQNSGLRSKIAERAVRQVPRNTVEGVIKWENRHISVIIPVNEHTSFETALSEAVREANGQVFNKQSENIEGQKAVRIDIGVEDVLEGEPVRITTHNIWLVGGVNTPLAPPPQEKSPTDEFKILGRLALIIDDFGLTMDGVSDLAELDRPLTFAILPYHTYSAAIARQAVAQGKQVMLHLPMEPLIGEHTEQTTILTSMSDELIKTRTREAIAAIPQLSGVNNHQGSKATTDARVMQAVLEVIQENGLFFVDSRTNSNSLAYLTAKNMGIRATENNHFIDNVADVEAIKGELRAAGRFAVRQGAAVAIGHIRPHTVTAIKAILPELEAMGVRLVFVSELVR